jgi:DNA helicase-2/ATP-dependent DNA helicase PcrA
LPVVRGFADEEEEAEAVAAVIAGRRRPGRASSGTAVLARTNARLRTVASALGRVGVPWRLRDPRPLTDRPGVRRLLAVLPPDAPVGDLVAVLSDAPAEPDRDALLAALAEQPEPAARTVAAFAAWLDASGARAVDAVEAGVELVTFHQAKGLEWPAVWVIGVEEGLVPVPSGDLEEEERLLYVALTRAEDELSVSWTAAAGPSRWIAAVAGAAAELASSPNGPEQRARLAGLRAAIDPSIGAAVARRHRLDVWRSARALGAGVEPATILPDGVLTSLAATADVSEDTIVRIGGRAAARWAPELARVLATA